MIEVKKVSYEWDIEFTDEDGNIMDHHHFDTCPGIPEESGTSLVLVRDVGTESLGMVDRQWAYVTDGKLPEFFEDSGGVQLAKVPQRFHTELAKCSQTVGEREVR